MTPANFDFHCHSVVSDGLLSPQDVARRAAANGVDLWALTDHDDLGGLGSARQAAEEAGMRFVGRECLFISSASVSIQRIPV